MKHRRGLIRVGIVIFFIAALYLVEIGPWGNEGVALYNDGFGTFDMKDYTPESVYSVLSGMSSEGLHIMKCYYMTDFIFIIGMGALQLMLATLVFKPISSSIPRKILNVVAVLRGVADIMENILLLYVVCHYAELHVNLVTAASFFTSIKLMMISIWSGLFIIGGICNGVGAIIKGAAKKNDHI